MAQPVGFFTDTTLCIGCKACEVACKEWNHLPDNPLVFRYSYDNTGQLDGMLRIASHPVDALHSQGVPADRIYGDKQYGRLHALFLLTDKPESYNLPSTESAVLPSRNNIPGYATAAITAVFAALAGLIAFRRRGESSSSPSPSGGSASSPSPSGGGSAPSPSPSGGGQGWG